MNAPFSHRFVKRQFEQTLSTIKVGVTDSYVLPLQGGDHETHVGGSFMSLPSHVSPISVCPVGHDVVQS